MKKSNLSDREQKIQVSLNEAISNNDIASLKRIVWRVGELELVKFANDLHKLISKSDDLLDYCIAWTLGRLKQKISHKPLLALIEKTGSVMVKRIVFEALLATATDSQQSKLLNSVKERLANYIDFSDTEGDDLTEALQQLVKLQHTSISEILIDVYLLTVAKTDYRSSLIGVLKQLPVRANYFLAIRHLYKSAEFRNDAELLALLAYKIETSTPQFSRFTWDFEYIRLPGTDQYAHFEEEIQKPDSRIAYSANTRDYFRRRTCRLLRKMGKSGDLKYIDFAKHLLLQFSDKDATRSKKSAKNFEAFSTYLAFNQVLYRHSDIIRLIPSGQAWETHQASNPVTADESIATLKRTEDFPEIWDQCPKVLHALLLTSQCEVVHRFAARALLDNQEYCKKLIATQLNELLASRYKETVHFALAQISLRFPDKHKTEYLIALSASISAFARKQAIEWMEQDLQSIQTTPNLLVAVLTSPYADIRQWGKSSLSAIKYDSEQSKELINSLFAYILDLAPDNADVAVIKGLGEILNGHFSDHVKRLEIRIVEKLLQHRLTDVQAIAGHIILNHGVSAEFLPVKVFISLMEAESDVARDIGIKLFKSLPSPPLLKQPDMLASFCVSEYQDVQQQARSRLRSLADQDTEFGRRVVKELIPYLFRKEKETGCKHEEIVSLIEKELYKAALKSDTDVIWRLLYARSKNAQQFGAFLLIKQDNIILKPVHWAMLANHEIEVVRQWAYKAYENSVDMIKSAPADSVQILNSQWKSSRQFGMRFFLRTFTAREWIPELLINICDNADHEIQQFAHELMLDFFQQGQGVEYLMKLSEHPSLKTQAFVSRFLTSFATDNIHRLKALTEYFLSVLNQINRGRRVKSTVLTFLHEESIKSLPAALVIAPILTRQSLSNVYRDKARILEIMTEIKLRFPEVNLPISLRTPVSRVELPNGA